MHCFPSFRCSLLSPFQTYRLYVALVTHFTSDSYDYFKYNGKTNANQASFEKRKDRFKFIPLSRKENPLYYFVANIVARNSVCWVGELLDSEAQSHYIEWKRRIESLSYNFEQDLRKLLTSFDKCVRVENKQRPALLKLYLQKRISPETPIILDQLFQIFSHWDEEFSDDLVWNQRSFLLKKYSPFVKINLEKYKKIHEKIFSED